MDDPTRRRRVFLRALAGTGAVAWLAGCNSTEESAEDRPTSYPSDTPTETQREETRETPTDTTIETETPNSSVSIEVETTVEEGNDFKHLGLSGHISSSIGIETVTFDADDDKKTIEGGGETRLSLDTELLVDGGRAYQIDVSVRNIDGNEKTTQIQTDHVPIFIDPLETDRTVGAHYYPWYGTRNHENWTERTLANPILGEYDSVDRAILDQHLKWSLEHGIEWWSVSWWGRNSPTERNLREVLLEAEQFDHIEFSILYETVGAFEQHEFNLSDSSARRRLKNDFEYLEETYFDRENYRRIDGRPVIYFYVSGALKGDVEGVFREATTNLTADPYILAGVPFGTTPSRYPIASVADAVTSYTPYEQREDIERVFHDNYERGNKVMNLATDAIGTKFIPVVTPGYNNTGIPDSRVEDSPVLSASPDRFERVIEQVSPHLADTEGVLVTSFNEWYETTAVEPSEEYGTEYLDLVADKLATGSSKGFEPTGTHLRLAFSETFVPAELDPDSSDQRELSFVASALSLLNGSTQVATYNIGDPNEEPLFLDGAYPPENYTGTRSRWFGGRNGQTVLFFEEEFSDIDRAVLTGEPMQSDEITATVIFEDQQTDTVHFQQRDGEFDEYELSLTP